MFEISFEVNGRRVRPNQVQNALEAALLKDVATRIRNSVGTIRCPVHEKNARVVARGKSIGELEFDISGCCENLIAEVRRRLS